MNVTPHAATYQPPPVPSRTPLRVKAQSEAFTWRTLELNTPPPAADRKEELEWLGCGLGGSACVCVCMRV